MGDSRRVLIVEDNDEIRDGLVALLRDHGHEVLEAENGQRGLELLRAHADVDLVVLDLMMPVMNGATFRWRQRWDASIADVPVLVLSSVVDGRMSAQVLEADGYLPKPIDPEALLRAVKRLGARRSRPRLS